MGRREGSQEVVMLIGLASMGLSKSILSFSVDQKQIGFQAGVIGVTRQEVGHSHLVLVAWDKLVPLPEAVN